MAKGSNKRVDKAVKKRGRRKQDKNKPSRAWLPDKSEVIKEITLLSPKGARYRILTTTEMDPYDRPIRKKRKTARTK